MMRPADSFPATDHWKSVDDVEPDGLSTDVIEYRSTYQRDLYNLSAFGHPGATINIVVVYACVYGYPDAVGYVKLAVKTGFVADNSSEQSIVEGEWTYRLATWTKNPETTLDWTPNEIENLQAGLSLKSDDAHYVSCTQVKIEVDYTAGVAYEKTLTENLGLVDKVVKAPSLVKSEPLDLLDTYSRTWAVHRTYSEPLGLLDAVSKGVVQHPLIEAIGLSDTVVKEPGDRKSVV